MNWRQLALAICAVVAVPGISTAQPAIGTSWNSWDTVVLDAAQATASGDFLNRGSILGSDGNTSAFLQMYTTAQTYQNSAFDIRVARSSSDERWIVDDDGNAPSVATTGVYRTNDVGTGSHFDNHTTFDQSTYWIVPAENGGDPRSRVYMGKAGPRPNDGSHGDLPGGVDGVSDLAFHSTNGGRVNVFAFVAPAEGFYEISNFALRRFEHAPSSRNRSSAVRIFDGVGNWIGGDNATPVHAQSDIWATTSGQPSEPLPEWWGQPDHPDFDPDFEPADTLRWPAGTQVGTVGGRAELVAGTPHALVRDWLGHSISDDHALWVHDENSYVVHLKEGEKVHFGLHTGPFTDVFHNSGPTINTWDLGNTELAFTITLADYAIGDLNTDSSTNRLDVIKMLRNYGRDNPSYTHGDVNRDGEVDLTDLATLQVAATQPSALTAAVPEPSTLVLALCTLLTAVAYRAGRRAVR